MRFGKKLALQVMEDGSGAPYLSHKPMKEAINRTVRELRLYQSRLQEADEARRCMPHSLDDQTSVSELRELMERVAEYDKQLFALVDEDLANLIQHVRLGETRISHATAALQAEAMDIGILVDETRLRQLQGKLPAAPENLQTLCQHFLALRLNSDPAGMANQLQEFGQQYNILVDLMNAHTRYIEINVAGFRKLLKRHEKQIPAQFRARQMPYLGFHKLVTRTSRQLLDVCKQLGQIQLNAWHQLARVDGHAKEVVASVAAASAADARELKGLGVECDMVLKIKKALKDPVNNLAQIAALDQSGDGQASGALYTKPDTFPSADSTAESAAMSQQQMVYACPAPMGSGTMLMPQHFAPIAFSGPCGFGGKADPNYFAWWHANPSAMVSQ